MRLSTLSYTDNYFVETCFNQIKYTYQICYDGVNLPKPYLLSEEPTNELGTKVYFKVENYKERLLFAEAIQNQLKYFDNVEVRGLTVKSSEIVKGKHFIYSNLNQSNKHVQICYGKNVYPLNTSHVSGFFHYSDYEQISMYFEVGELDLLPNREQLQYTPRTIQAIKDKYELCKQELQGLYDIQTNIVYDNLWDYLKVIEDPSKSLTLNSFKVPVGFTWQLVKNCKYKSTYSSLLKIPNSEVILNCFQKAKTKKWYARYIEESNKGVWCEGKGFSTYKLKHNNKSFIVNLEDYHVYSFSNFYEDKKIAFSSLSDDLKLELKAAVCELLEDFKKDTKEKLTYVGELESPIVYTSKKKQKLAEDTYCIRRLNSNLDSILTLNEILKSPSKYVVFNTVSELRDFCDWKVNYNNRKALSQYIVKGNKPLIKKLTELDKITTTDEFFKQEYIYNAMLRWEILNKSFVFPSTLKYSYPDIYNKIQTFEKYKNILRKHKNLFLLKPIDNFKIDEDNEWVKLLNEIESFIYKHSTEIRFSREYPSFYQKYVILSKNKEKWSKQPKLETT